MTGRGGQKISGALLHVKFLNTLEEKLTDALSNAEHYQESAGYRHYTNQMANSPALFIPGTDTFKNWIQLETLGVMSRGAWAQRSDGTIGDHPAYSFFL